MKDKLIITSTNPNLSEQGIEEQLEKALSVRKIQQEKKNFDDLYLKDRKNKVAYAVHLVFQSMINEIDRVLKGNNK